MESLKMWFCDELLEGTALLWLKPVLWPSLNNYRHKSSGLGLGLDDNIFLIASFQIANQEQAIQDPVSGAWVAQLF